MKIKRAVHVDFHTMPNVYDFGERYDAEEFAKTLKGARVEYINLVACCNLGFCYFPTDVGVRYPYLKGDRFGTTLKACKEAGIGVSAYINAGLSHENAYLHPDWCRVNERGERIYGDKTGNFFRCMCYNSTGYRSYLLGLVKELISRYDLDGFFFDCLKINPCYCPKCLADMQAEGIDVRSRRAVKEFNYRKMRELCAELKTLIGNRHVFFCGLPWKDGLSDHIEVECLPSGNWGYDYFPQAAAYARNFTDDIVYMTGRFQADWGDFGGIRSKASFEYDLYDALSNGLTLSVGDHLHPAENLDSNLYRTVGELYLECERYERYALGAKYVAEIGVLNGEDIFFYEKEKYTGVARMLNELRYPFDFITEESDFSRYKLLLLADDYAVSGILKKKLSAYLNAGGKILSTGTSALNKKGTAFALPQYGFLVFCGKDENNVPYFSFTNETGERTKWAEYESGVLMKNNDGCELADYIRPYNRRYWDGRHGYFYTPPEKKTAFSSAVWKGNVAHVSFRIFTAYAKYFLAAHRKLVGEILKILLPEPLFRSDTLPITARLSLTKTEAHALLHVRTTYPEIKGGKGVIEVHTEVSAGTTVELAGEYGEAYDALTGEPVRCVKKKGCTRIKLPRISGYKMIVLK